MTPQPSPALARTTGSRRAKRHLTVLMVGKVRGNDGEYACVVNDISRHGLKARFPHPPAVGERLHFSLRGLPELAATVRWIDGRRAGVEFAAPLDLTAILGPQVADRLPRAPRFACRQEAALTLDGRRRPITLVDMSLGGAKLTLADPPPANAAGHWAALAVPGLGEPRAGTICWSRDDRVGFRFAMPLALEALAAVLAQQDQPAIA